MKPTLTVTIPSYKQQPLLRRCLESLRSQTRKDFLVVIIDDKSNEDFSSILQDFSDLHIEIVVNEHNRGAMGNIFHSITYPVQTPFILSLHEDDFLHPQYIERAIEKLEHDASIAFVASRATWFMEHEDMTTVDYKELSPSGLKLSQEEFVRQILLGTHIIFGSIVYRAEVVKGTSFDLETYSTLCDRPFLIELLAQKRTSFLLDDPGVFVRDHGKKDLRNAKLREPHVLNLFSFYKTFSSSFLEVFYTASSNGILLSYYPIVHHDMSPLKYLKKAISQDLFKISNIRLSGFLGLAGMIFGRSLTIHILHVLKKLKMAHSQKI